MEQIIIQPLYTSEEKTRRRAAIARRCLTSGYRLSTAMLPVPKFTTYESPYSSMVIPMTILGGRGEVPHAKFGRQRNRPTHTHTEREREREIQVIR